MQALALKAHVADTVVPNLNATLAHHVLEKKGTEALLIKVTQDAELDLAKQREAHQRELRALHEAHAAHELKMIDQRNAQAKELREENLNVKAMEQELFELRGREDYLAQSLGEAEKDRRNVSDRLSSEQRRHKLSLQWRGLKAWTRVRSGNWLRDLIEIWHLNMVYDGKLMVMDLVEEARDTEEDLRQRALRCFYRVFGHNHRKECVRRWRVDCFRHKSKLALHDKAQILARNTALIQDLKNAKVAKDNLVTRLEAAEEAAAAQQATHAKDKAEWAAALDASRAETRRCEAAQQALAAELEEARATQQRELAEMRLRVEQAFDQLQHGSEERLRDALAEVQARERAELVRAHHAARG